MDEAMVTGRMDREKKIRGGRVLERSGLTASHAINLLYDRLIEEGSADFLSGRGASTSTFAWQNATRFVDSLSERRPSRFDDMTKAEIRADRLKSRGLL